MMFFSPSNRCDPDNGYLASPAGQVRTSLLTRPWGCDNQVFTEKFNSVKFFSWLRRALPYRPWCKFVVCPDRVRDCETTRRQWPHFSAAIRELGYPVAFAAQDGMEPDDLPDDADALFVGGSDDWKLYPPCVEIIRLAQARGMWVHVGRATSLDRIGHCKSLGVDSFDNTYTVYAPDKLWPRLRARMSQGVLF